MEINLALIQPKVLAELKKLWVNDLKNNQMPDLITTEEDVEMMINMLYLLKKKEKIIIDRLHESGIVKDTISSVFEKSIKTIASHDWIDKILHPNKEKKKQWMTTRLSVYLSNVLQSELKGSSSYLAKQIYNKHSNALKSKIQRVEKSPKIAELALKYPSIDIKQIVKLGVLHNKIELTNSDLEWLDQTINLINNQTK